MAGTGLLTYRQLKPGLMKCSLELSRLFTTVPERRVFKRRFDQFLEADPCNQKVYRLDRDRLTFWSEQLIPLKKDNRIPLLMVFGNPAPRSVHEGMFFAYEGGGREHRFWKHIMGKSGFIDFSMDSGLSVSDRNKRRKKQLLSLDYRSVFRVGLTVFITLPSGASGPWAGNGGIRRLLGARAMREITRHEQARLLKVSKKFLGKAGIVTVFQKDAWEGLRSPPDPVFHIESAKQGNLKGKVNSMPHYRLYGLPPTRLTGPCRRVLRGVIKDVLKG